MRRYPAGKLLDSKGPEVLADINRTRASHVPLPPRKPTSSWAALGKVTAAAQGGVSFSLLRVGKDTPGVRRPVLGPSNARDLDILESQKKDHRGDEGTGAPLRRAKESGTAQPRDKEAQQNLKGRSEDGAKLGARTGGNERERQNRRLPLNIKSCLF